MIKKIALFAFAALLAVGANAQLKFGVKAGLNMSNMTNKDKDKDYDEDYKMKPGFHIGLTAEYAISENLSVEPGLLFSTKGYKVDESGIKMKANLNYFEVPINVLYKFDLGGVKAFVNAGPYLGFAMSGKIKADEKIFEDEEGNPTDEMDIEIGSDKEKDDVKAFDFGLNLGVGAEISNITLGLQYGFGLANLAPVTENDYKLKNKGFALSVGYKF